MLMQSIEMNVEGLLTRSKEMHTVFIWNWILKRSHLHSCIARQSLRSTQSGKHVLVLKKKTSDASPGSTSSDEEIGVCTDAFEKEQRPRDVNHEKERRGKAHASDGSGVKLSLESVWAQKLEKDGIKECAKSPRYAQAFELQKRQIALQ